MGSPPSSPFVEQPSRLRDADLELQRRLWDQQMLQQTQQYEKTLAARDAEIRKLTLNFEFLEKENEQLALKLRNHEQLAQKTLLPRQLSPLAVEERLEARLKQAERSAREAQQQTKEAHDEVQLLTQQLEQANQRARDAVERTDTALALLARRTAALSASHDDLQQTQVENVRLKQRVAELEATAADALAYKQRAEVAREEAALLQKQLWGLDGVEERAQQMEIENLRLTARLQLFEGIDVSKTVGELKQARVDLEVVQEAAAAMEAELKGEMRASEALRDELAAARDQVEAERAAVATQKAVVADRERVLALNAKEIEYLRRQLDGGDTSAYVSRLEKQVDEFRAQLQNKVVLAGPVTPRKRPASPVESYTPLRHQNTALARDVKRLQHENHTLGQQVATLEQALAKKKGLQTLQLRHNPLASDQFVKRAQLEALERENADLRRHYVDQAPGTELVPKLVLERQQHDTKLVQRQADTVGKRNLRLKEQYQKMTLRVVALMLRYFGYLVKFVEDPMNPLELLKLRLELRYWLGPGHLTIDTLTKELDVHGSAEFKEVCARVMKQWADEHHEVPLFLAALNMELYEKIEK